MYVYLFDRPLSPEPLHVAGHPDGVDQLVTGHAGAGTLVQEHLGLKYN